MQTTESNYQSQINALSDHLAGMNDTLAKQRDEIDSLKLSMKVNIF